MAQQTETVKDLMQSENVTVRRGTRHDWVAEVWGDARTGGPAMDPVEVWTDHQDQYDVEYVRDAGGATVYTLTRVLD